MATPMLLAIPYDIKVLILKDLLCTEEPLVITEDQNRHGSFQLDPAATQNRSFAILRVCRELFHDAAYILYRFNTFKLGSDSHRNPILGRWAKSIGAANTALIRKVVLEINLPSYPIPDPDEIAESFEDGQHGLDTWEWKVPDFEAEVAKATRGWVKTLLALPEYFPKLDHLHICIANHPCLSNDLIHYLTIFEAIPRIQGAQRITLDDDDSDALCCVRLLWPGPEAQGLWFYGCLYGWALKDLKFEIWRSLDIINTEGNVHEDDFTSSFFSLGELVSMCIPRNVSSEVHAQKARIRKVEEASLVPLNMEDTNQDLFRGLDALEKERELHSLGPELSRLEFHKLRLEVLKGQWKYMMHVWHRSLFSSGVVDFDPSSRAIVLDRAEDRIGFRLSDKEVIAVMSRK